MFEKCLNHYLTGDTLRATFVKKFKHDNHDIFNKKAFGIEKYIIKIMFKNYS